MMRDATQSEVFILRHGEKEAVRFVTPSGVKAIIATSIDPDLLRSLRKKLERKLRASGHLIEQR
jgi:hypothetical protein